MQLGRRFDDPPPRALGSRLHPHTSEDEYSYVFLEGRLGAQLGDDVVEAGPGELVRKPRGQEHAFWNAGNEPLRFLELISPGDFATIPALAERHGLNVEVPA